MNLIIHYPNGETKTHKGVKEIAIDRNGFAFKKGKSPAIFKASFLVISGAEAKEGE